MLHFWMRPAAAEAMAVARRVNKSKAEVFFVDETCHPQTVAVIRTRAESLGWQIKTGCPKLTLSLNRRLGRCSPIPPQQERLPMFLIRSGGCQSRGLFLYSGSGSACADDPEIARRNWGGYGYRLCPAFWCADGLWRPACGLYGDN